MSDMKLRKLRADDAPLMLEWMHDDSVTHDLQTDFASKTLDDALTFINNSLTDEENLNLAIVDDNDEYMGTVSLKHIHEGKAEFGITVRRCAMGKGYSSFGMEEILQYGFRNIKLNYVYWCVDPVNARALRFYDKHGYLRISHDEIAETVTRLGSYDSEEIKQYVWYITTDNNGKTMHE